MLRSWNQNGMLALVFAHLMSLELMREMGALPNEVAIEASVAARRLRGRTGRSVKS